MSNSVNPMSNGVSVEFTSIEQLATTLEGKSIKEIAQMFKNKPISKEIESLLIEKHGFKTNTQTQWIIWEVGKCYFGYKGNEVSLISEKGSVYKAIQLDAPASEKGKFMMSNGYNIMIDFYKNPANKDLELPMKKGSYIDKEGNEQPNYSPNRVSLQVL